MPIHDWTRVPAGIFHHLHGSWIFELAGELNEGVLPDGYYALGEQVASGVVPDVITLERREADPGAARSSAAALPDPRATICAVAEKPVYPTRPRVLVIRHVSGDRVVAILEIVSPANKRDTIEIGALVEKSVGSLSRGVHLVLIDLFPPGPHDPAGLHNLVWEAVGQQPISFDPGRPIQFSSYRAGRSIQAFIEPRQVGEELPDLPLFLSERVHVPLPLPRSYGAAFARLPAHLRHELEERPAS